MENSDFDSLKKKLDEKKKEFRELDKAHYNLKKEINLLKSQLQKVCDHEYVREVTTTGPYREINNICVKCEHWG